MAEEIARLVRNQLSSIDFGLRLRSILDSADFVFSNIPLHLRFTHLELRSEAIQKAPSAGLLMEFGVASGFHINRMAAMTDRCIYGFDSFEGLPADWSLWRRGAYDRGGMLPQVAANVRLVKGWFNETLPPFLLEHPETVAFVHIDCDLYASTETVLEALHPRFIPGTTLVLDDFLCEPGWQKEEHKAFLDYVKRHDVEFEYLGYAVESPSCAVAVQLTRVPA